jgi:hypothetical protein
VRAAGIFQHFVIFAYRWLHRTGGPTSDAQIFRPALGLARRRLVASPIVAGVMSTAVMVIVLAMMIVVAGMITSSARTEKRGRAGAASR